MHVWTDWIRYVLRESSELPDGFYPTVVRCLGATNRAPAWPGARHTLYFSRADLLVLETRLKSERLTDVARGLGVTATTLRTTLNAYGIATDLRSRHRERDLGIRRMRDEGMKIVEIAERAHMSVRMIELILSRSRAGIS